jgi:hypothetical protein
MPTATDGINAKHGQHSMNALKSSARPIFDDLSVDKIDTEPVIYKSVKAFMGHKN